MRLGYGGWFSIGQEKLHPEDKYMIKGDLATVISLNGFYPSQSQSLPLSRADLRKLMDFCRRTLK